MAAEQSVVGSAANKPQIENGVPASISSVIPGWFSEISPMWPGGFFRLYILFSFCLALRFVRRLSDIIVL